jgi:D-galactarolactone isomerase
MDGRFFEEREDLLRRLPCTLVIEHIGKFLEPVLPDHRGFQSLLRILESGRCWVKLSGAYMMSKRGPPLYEDIGILAKALVQRAPERLVWASNWPHPLSGAHGVPDDAALLDTLLDWAPEADTRNRILAQNPAELYGFGTWFHERLTGGIIMIAIARVFLVSKNEAAVIQIWGMQPATSTPTETG